MPLFAIGVCISTLLMLATVGKFFNYEEKRKKKLNKKLKKSSRLDFLLSYKRRTDLFAKRKKWCIIGSFNILLGLLFAFIQAELQIQETKAFNLNNEDTIPTIVTSDYFNLEKFNQINNDNQNRTEALANQLSFIQNIQTTFKLNICYKNYCKFNWLITLTSILGIFGTFKYHWYEIEIYKFDNSIAPDSGSILNWKKKLWLIVEYLLYLVQPFTCFHIGSFLDFPMLTFLMLIRLVLLFRLVIICSLPFNNVKTITFASLNQINIGSLNTNNIRLVVRTYMDESAGTIMMILVAANWVIMAWCLRLTEAREYIITGSEIGHDFKDMLWLVPITFTTIGYGDFYPHSIIGRVCVLWIGFSGIVSAAILVTVMTDMLTMTRRERLLHRVLNIDAIDGELRHRAAIVLQRTFRRYKTGKPVIEWPKTESFGDAGQDTEDLKVKAEALLAKNILTEEEAEKMPTEVVALREDEVIPGKIKGLIPVIFDGKILDAITRFKKLRIERKFMSHDQHDMVDLGIMQSDNNHDISDLKERVNKLNKKMDLIIETLSKREGKKSV